LAKAVIDFRQPINSYNNYYVSVRCSRIGKKSFDINYLITKEENGNVTTMAEGTTVMVCFNYETQETISMKNEWRQSISKFEGKELT
ncbi:MAG: thioesterase family protein, partial [Chitinophagales bacterium]